MSLARTAKLPVPKWVTGEWHDVRDLVGGSTANFSITNGTIYESPIYVPEPCTLDRIGINVAVAGAASTVGRLMLYANLANGRPGALLVDGGTVAVDSTGDKEVTIALAVPAGIIRAAFISTGAPQLQGLATTYRGINGTATPTPTAPRGTGTNAVGGSAAPNPFPTTLAYSVSFLRVAVRVA